VATTTAAAAEDLLLQRTMEGRKIDMLPPGAEKRSIPSRGERSGDWVVG